MVHGPCILLGPHCQHSGDTRWCELTYWREERFARSDQVSMGSRRFFEFLVLLFSMHHHTSKMEAINDTILSGDLDQELF